MTKDPETALRSLLRGRLDRHERQVRGFAEPEWQRWADLLAGALLVAARRRFPPEQDRAPLIRFVASARERYDATGLDVDPTLAEAVLRAALGEGSPPPEEAATLTARILLLLGLLEDEGLPPADLDDLLTAAWQSAEGAAGTGA
ncbi:hypothetical protein [Micromonospora sagamiensis]|uniref:Uncharacterized protein n=1 Tax=Micromonospora sagamiensis TaxID=47875 RepID=A0A562WD40_9ACTN|nr:hypothetical protein [Micromonospora sagamiensis]TWJ28209.1 hypothetical protein JD81_01712 [Micromonospora sagamiensis]BCL12900.1 hypothetical protein GCM10017556_06390 [Micromonospora sagamiensis]